MPTTRAKRSPSKSKSSAKSPAAPQPGPLVLHPALTPLPVNLQGPFVNRPGGGILTLDNRQLLLSRDRGKTWKPRPLFNYGPHDKEFKLSNERVLLRTARDTLILSFMNINERVWGWRDELRDTLPGTRCPNYVMRSTDGGDTWRDVACLHEDWTGDLRTIIQCRGGRIVISSMKMLHNPGRHGVITYYSDDDGATWKASNLIDLGGMGHHAGGIEATIAQLNDGRVWMLIRTNWGKFWEAYSHDEGASWRQIGPTALIAPSAPALLHRLASGRLIMLWNPTHPADQPDKARIRGGDGIWAEVPASYYREKLAAAFSTDDGRTWSNPVILASKENSWVSYPRVFEPKPGELWISTMQGALSAKVLEKDLL
jgi:hypothetical protein